MSMPATRTSVASWIVFAIAVTLAVGASIREDIRPTQTDPPRLIGHADQAHTALVARNIALGAGGVSTALWLLRDLPEDQQLVYGENYWSVYVAYYLSLFFRVMKPDLTTVIFAASICKSLLGLICAGVVLRLTKSKLASFSALAMILLSPSMSRSTNGLSDLYLTFGVTLAALALAFAAVRHRLTLFFASGLATGFAIGAKSTGMILFGVYGCYLLFERLRPYAVRAIAVAGGGVALALLPQVAHNMVHHDAMTFLPAASERVFAASWVRHVTLSHDRGFYSNQPLAFDPGSTLSDRLDRSTALIQGWFEVTFRDGDVISFALIVPYLIAIALALGYRRFRQEKMDAVSRNILGLSVLMLGAGLVVAAMVHVESRYLNFLVPFLVLTIVLVGARISPVVPILCAALLVPVGFDTLRNREFRALSPSFEIVERTLPNDAVLYTANPWEVAFHTRRRTVSLPHSDWEEFWELASRFNITHVVILDGDARHPIYSPLERYQFPPGIKKVHAGPRLIIGALDPTARKTEPHD